MSLAVQYVAVCGPGEATAEELSLAREVGEGLGDAGVMLVCGGLGGVMEAACRGAQEYGGMTVGLLPGADRAAANPYLTIAIPTGMGELRNGLIVRAADAVIAVGGAYGTLSEIAFALKTGTPVYALGGWDLPDVVAVRSPVDAVARALGVVS